MDVSANLDVGIETGREWFFVLRWCLVGSSSIPLRMVVSQNAQRLVRSVGLNGTYLLVFRVRGKGCHSKIQCMVSEYCCQPEVMIAYRVTTYVQKWLESVNLLQL